MNPCVFFRLFDAQVMPALLYGAELWGITKGHIVENAHLFACKRFLNIGVRSSNTMCYGELGRYPIQIRAMINAVKYWLRIATMSDNRLPRQTYNMLLRANVPLEHNWTRIVEDCLSRLGFLYVWRDGGISNEKSFIRSLKQRLRDIYKGKGKR